jgi:PmbA protein
LCDLANEVLKGIGKGQPDVSIELEVRRVRETVGLRNSSGGEAHLSRVWLEGEAWVERHSGSDVLVVLDGFTTARVKDGSHREFARRMARRLRWARKPVEPQTGRQSAIFSPTAFASLLRPMLYAFNGMHAVQASSRGSKRQSGFAGKLGQQLFDPRFSLYDDATLPGLPRSAPVDHEDTPGQRTALIEHGFVNGFYHNLVSAARAETRSTGNGWRWMIDPPLPSPTNVQIDRGENSLSDMLKHLDHGLLIDLVAASDASTGLRGDFSRTIVLAYQVRHGRVVGFVRGAGVSGDLYRSLQNLEALGRDGFWSGDIFTPYIQLGGVTITA